jgi:hypothetical protein
MTNDITGDEFDDPATMNKRLPDEVPADPVAVVLMLQREAGNLQQENQRMSRPLKQAVIKEKVLRRMLEHCLEHPSLARKSHLKIIK